MKAFLYGLKGLAIVAGVICAVILTWFLVLIIGLSAESLWGIKYPLSPLVGIAGVALLYGFSFGVVAYFFDPQLANRRGNL